MQVVQTIGEVRAFRRDCGLRTLGLVPTMGALHDGHLSLVRRAREENDFVGVSIFVNPAQFNNASDLQKYPRDDDRDLALLEDCGVDLVWLPKVDDVYPPGFQTYVTVEDVTRPLEGTSRPGHFRGVATVCLKLFNVFESSRAYFGEKDAQQLVTIRTMVRDIGLNMSVVGCPTVREPNGLAMSSRNALLSEETRDKASVIFKALQRGAQCFDSGERAAQTIRHDIERTLATEALFEIDYVSVADPDTLIELETVDDSALLSVAVAVGSVRLIDNCTVGVRARG
jgi:pantoate--beta-alanine ligase